MTQKILHGQNTPLADVSNIVYFSCMKKTLFAFIFLLSSFNLLAKDSFTLLPGKLHIGGLITSELVSVNDQQSEMRIKFTFNIDKRLLVPVPPEYLQGQGVETLPSLFADERGYLELEHQKKMKFKEATIYHLGRRDEGKYKDGHLIKIVPNNGKAEVELFYHPHLSGLGYGRVRVLIKTNIPLLHNYVLEAQRM